MKARRWVPHGRKYERAANAMARGFCPPIRPCMKCGGPAISGYCCTHCGDTDPREAVK